VSVDIQGYLVEKLSGKTFPEFLRTRLFEPLGMVDTAFYVPADKLARVSTIYASTRRRAASPPRPARAS
jgi:CubicO group peptidase (beta-lactamase class C family)